MNFIIQSIINTTIKNTSNLNKNYLEKLQKQTNENILKTKNKKEHKVNEKN